MSNQSFETNIMGLGLVGFFFKKGENWNTWRKTFQTKEEDHQSLSKWEAGVITLTNRLYSCSCSSGARPPPANWSIGTRQCHVKGRPYPRMATFNTNTQLNILKLGY